MASCKLALASNDRTQWHLNPRWKHVFGYNKGHMRCIMLRTLLYWLCHSACSMIGLQGSLLRVEVGTI